ncbi:phosphatase PAP2 family protein [Mucilaginibacter aquatilis]|uniref:phosphatase PAP2 family protein n=1 Tax=Mucilaginibacter aquatilis TaxID=1517760 RepID=UPI0018DD85B2|nr:phosphatase PAP2 family protein [Mucilaginibacter aquatilis]
MNKLDFGKYILTIATALATCVSASAQLSQPTFLRQIDTDIMVNLSENRTPPRTDFYYFMSKTNLYGNALVPASLLIGGAISGNKEMRQNAAYVASSSVLSYGAVLLIKKLLKRPRPFRGNYRIIPVYIAGDYSFPSGHSSSAVSTATSLSIAYPKWYVIAPAALWAGSVAYSRMYLGLHYPSDVATGSLMGAGTAVYLNTIRNRVQ